MQFTSQLLCFASYFPAQFVATFLRSLSQNQPQIESIHRTGVKRLLPGGNEEPFGSLPCVTDFEGFPLGNAIFNFRRKSLLYFTTFPRHRSPTFSAGFCQCKKYLTNTAVLGKVSSSSSTRSDWSAAAFYATSTTTACHFFRRTPGGCEVDVSVGEVAENIARYLTVDSPRARTARIFASTDSGHR